MENEIELSEIWRIIRSRIVMILSLTMVAVVVSGLVSFFVMKPKYEATATLLVQSQKSDSKDLTLNDNLQLVKTYEEVIKSNRIAEDVIQNLKLSLTETQLLDMVQVKSDTGSLVTTITVTDRDPVQAANIVNGFARSFYTNINSIMKVDNVSILDQAKIVDHPTPVSPKPYLNMAIALVLGIMIGIGIAFLIEYLDKTVKTEEEIERLLELPVLSVIASFDTEHKKGKNRLEVSKGGAGSEIKGNTEQINLPV